MDFLSRREHSKKELFNKLFKRVDNFELLNQEIDKLANEGLQSDERFSEAYIRSKTQKVAICDLQYVICTIYYILFTILHYTIIYNILF